MSNEAIYIQDLWKRYRVGQKKSTSFRESVMKAFTREESEYFWALKGINFQVKHGEAVGIIGKNGAGKSTLLKILSKITYPTRGQVVMNGRVSSLLEVGTGFHMELTGRQNIYLNGTILGMSRREISAKFDEIVVFSGVEKFIDTPVKHYSSGMKVRLAFSVAAHLEPEILIIDEVLAVGDAEFQRKCLGKMEDVADEGRTVLFVSHNMGAVESLCSKGILLSSGEVSFIGTQVDTIGRYLISRDRETELIKRDDRKGNGLLIVEKIVINDSSQNRIEQVKTGQALYIDFHFKSETKINRPVITIHITDNQDIPIFMFHSRMSGTNFRDIEGDGIFCCHIKKLALPPGEYFISYTLIEEGSYLDGLEYAKKLQVISGDFYGTGEIPTRNQSKVLLDAEWIIRKTHVD